MSGRGGDAVQPQAVGDATLGLEERDAPASGEPGLLVGYGFENVHAAGAHRREDGGQQAGDG